MQRLGIIGGSFDPIHYGHLAIAEEARVRLSLDRVLFVPAAQQPLKGLHHTSAQQRLAMVQHATADNLHFAVSDIEIQREGVSYTVDTLRTLHQQYPNCELWFIVGADSVFTLPQWHAVDQLIELTQFAVFDRPQNGADFAPVFQALPRLEGRMKHFIGPQIDLSASELRARIADHLPIRYLVPNAVAAYIAEHQLYQAL